MKPFAMPRSAACYATALELIPAEHTVRSSAGKARSGGRGPRPPFAVGARASVPVAIDEPSNWSGRGRRRRARRDSNPGGMAARA